METIIFILGVIGITHIIVDSNIFLPTREWFEKYLNSASFKEIKDNFFTFWTKKENITQFVSKIIHCYQCAGFWVGVILGLSLKLDILFLISCGGTGSFLAVFAGAIMQYIDTQIIINLDDK